MEEAMSNQAVIRMPGQAKVVTLSGEPLAFLVTGEHTRHTSMFEWTMPARFSTGLHVHRVQEETFYVLEGECDWQIGDQCIRATPGTYVFIPPGVPHNIANPGDKPARVIMTVSPPGHEHYFEELAKLVVSGKRPEPDAIAALRQRYDTDQHTVLQNQ
jgi:quercetin dioxygenase-like cupin family protein